MPITLDQTIRVAHLNIRKEGPDDDKHLVVDMKIEARSGADLLAEFDPTLRHLLFNAGAPRYPKMGPIKWAGEANHMELDTLGLCLLDVKLHKFQIAPFAIQGQEFIDLTCTATFAPSGRDTAILAEQVGEEIAIKLTPGMQLDLRQNLTMREPK